MYYQENMCCLCLTALKDSKNDLFTKRPQKMTYFSKLSASFTKVAKVVDTKYKHPLCKKCCASIDSVYEFHETSLKNIRQFSSYRKLLGASKNQKEMCIKVKIERNVEKDFLALDEEIVDDFQVEFLEEIKTEDVSIKNESPEPLEYCLVLDDSDLVGENSNDNDIEEFLMKTENLDDFSSEVEIFLPETIFVEELPKIKRRYRYFCEKCPQVFFSKYDYLRHEMSHSDDLNEPNFCRQGEKSASSVKTNFLEHSESQNFISLAQKSTPEIKTNEKRQNVRPLRLSEKLEKLKAAESLYEQNSNENVRPTSFEDYKKSGDVRKPIETYSEDRPYKCGICPKTFRTKQILLNHLKVHQKREFFCQFCKNYYRDNSSFITHSCPKQNEILKGGIIILQNAKNQPETTKVEETIQPESKISIDNVEMDQRENLENDFEDQIDSLKKWKCKFCPKSFPTTYYLRKHQNQHEKNYKCSDCPATFLFETNLKIHQKMRHKVEDKKLEIGSCYGEKLTRNGQEGFGNVQEATDVFLLPQKLIPVKDELQIEPYFFVCKAAEGLKTPEESSQIGLEVSNSPIGSQLDLREAKGPQRTLEGNKRTALGSGVGISLGESPTDIEVSTVLKGSGSILKGTLLRLEGPQLRLGGSQLRLEGPQLRLEEPQSVLEGPQYTENRIGTQVAPVVDVSNLGESPTVVEVSAELEGSRVSLKGPQLTLGEPQSVLEGSQCAGSSTGNLLAPEVSLNSLGEFPIVSNKLEGLQLTLEGPLSSLKGPKSTSEEPQSDLKGFQSFLGPQTTLNGPQSNSELILKEPQGPQLFLDRPRTLKRPLSAFENPSETSTFPEEQISSTKNIETHVKFMVINPQKLTEDLPEGVPMKTEGFDNILEPQSPHFESSTKTSQVQKTNANEETLQIGATLLKKPTVDLSKDLEDFPQIETKGAQNISESQNIQLLTADQKIVTIDFETYNNLLKRQKMQSKLTCDICSKVFSNRSNLNIHKKLHSATRDEKCKFCSAAFKTKNDLKRHQQRRHKNRSEVSNETTSGQYFSDGESPINRIDQKLATNSNSNLNLATNLQNEGVETSNLQNLKRHLQRREVSNETTSVQYFSDGESLKDDMKLATNLNLTSNLNLETNEGKTPKLATNSQNEGVETPKLDFEKFVCDICGKIYRTQNGLRCHMKSHGPRRHECQICHKRFFLKQYLTVHMETHYGEAKFVCELCGKSFITRTLLYCHKKSFHSTARPYECFICKNKYKTKNGLQHHIRVEHEGRKETKSHQCKICNKTYTNLYSLRDHLRAHENEKNYKCDICGKEFIWSQSFSRHRQWHKRIDAEKSGTENLPIFPCKICCRDFKFASNLQRHMRLHRKKSDPKVPLRRTRVKKLKQRHSESSGAAVTLTVTSINE